MNHRATPRSSSVGRTDRPEEMWESRDEERRTNDGGAVRPQRRGRTLEVAHDVAWLPLSLVNVYFFGGSAEDGRSNVRNWVLIDA